MMSVGDPSLGTELCQETGSASGTPGLWFVLSRLLCLEITIDVSDFLILRFCFRWLKGDK